LPPALPVDDSTALTYLGDAIELAQLVRNHGATPDVLHCVLHRVAQHATDIPTVRRRLLHLRALAVLARGDGLRGVSTALSVSPSSAIAFDQGRSIPPALTASTTKIEPVSEASTSA